MSTRLTVNLLAFAALAVVMAVWAFNNVVRFDFIDRPYHITVEFASSPGLHPGFEVDYLGLRIGKIDSVRLAGDRVRVTLDIDKGIEIPRGVKAAAARKSAVGEPVVELTPPPGGGVDGPKMRPGAVIPMSQTTVPPRYGDLFGAVITSLKAIDPHDAQVLTRELAAGWSGREGSLRQIINGGDQLTGTFAENTEVLDGLTKDLAKITRVLNQNRDQLGAGIDNLAALTAALAQVRGELTTLRDTGPDLLATVNSVLDKTRPDFTCAVDTLATLGLTQYNPAVYRDLRQTLALAPELKVVLDNILGTDQGKPVLNVAFMLTLQTKAALEYKTPLPQPRANRQPACPDGRRPAEQVAQKPYQAKNPGATIPTHDPSIQAGNTSGEGGDGGPPPWLVYVPPVLAALVLLRVMAGSVPVLARRRRRRKD
ncbi:MCE family protein [Actinomadura sp. SCN-SB]|uniref:MCE family protein n=1 Tax=Actinomadura sp. SCN-SB TaxID=3373092 RepID=UPI0037521744